MRRGFHILDKDLKRITYAEIARFHASRPVLWLGLVVLVCAGLLILSIGVTDGHRPGYLTLGAAVVVACWLGLAIGANDVANSLGPVIGAGAITLLPGLVIVALAEVAGASLASAAVTKRISEGIFQPDLLQSALQEQVLMLAALIAAATWITMATGARLPVSTSHSIVGAVAGAAVAAFGAGAVHWAGLLIIASTWILSPLAAGGLAAGILAFVTVCLQDAQDRPAAARRWLPRLVGAMVGLFLAYLARLLAIRLGFPQLPLMVAAMFCAAPVSWAMRHRLSAELARDGTKPRMKHLFRPPLLTALVIMAFAHGANDVGNIAGPLSVILQGESGPALQVPLSVPLIAGLVIALGTLLFGRRLVLMVGTGITRLNPVRAFCVTLATAAIVLAASAVGLPVSTTHIAVGGIFGVGFMREYLDRRRQLSRMPMPTEEIRRRQLIRRSHVATITAAWVVTVPVSAVMGAVCYFLIRLAVQV